MDLDELQTAQSRERQTDSLQQLRPSFYADAGEFIQSLRERRDRVAEAADDPFDAPEVNRLTDDINTAEDTVEAIYERRVGKIVKMASLAAADMPTGDDGLTAEEQDLFDTLVGAIESNRGHVLDVLAGDASPTDQSTPPTSADASTGERAQTDRDQSTSTADSTTPSEQPTPPAPPESGAEPPSAGATDSETVDAAGLMGGGADDSGDPPVPPSEDVTPPSDGSREQSSGGDSDHVPTTDGSGQPESPTRSSDKSARSDGGTDTGGADRNTIDRATVRITDDVGAIYGVDQREYDLSADDVVTLPTANAEPLLNSDAAERLG